MAADTFKREFGGAGTNVLSANRSCRAKRDGREADRWKKRQPKAKVAVVAALAAPGCPHRRRVELAVAKVTITIITM